MYFFFNRYFSLNLFIIRFTEIIFIYLFAYLATGIHFDYQETIIIDYSVSRATVVASTYLLIFYLFDLYSAELYKPDRQMIIKLTQASISSAFILFSIYFFYPHLSFGRGMLVASAVALPILLIAWRAVFTEVLSVEIPEKRVVILGYGELGKKIAFELLKWYGHGLVLIGFIDENPSSIEKSGENPENLAAFNLPHNKPARRKEDLKIIGYYGDIARIATSMNIYKMIVAIPDRRSRLPISALLECKLKGVHVVEGETFLERMTGKVPTEQIKPSWLVFSEGFKSLKSMKTLKRFGDVCLSIIGLILASPILLIVYLLIKLESKGPVIFKQVRVGEKGKEFNIYKFRSMKMGAEDSTGPVWAAKKDNRVTTVGYYLRRFRIDEIPQMINVFKGDMSFVGPRPERPYFVAELKQKIPYYEMRTLVKPGVTGWAQIEYSYGATIQDAIEKLQYDIYYIKNMSPIFDLMIILHTIKVVLGRKGSV